ncbi:MAG: histidine kinase [Myxococcota bacterium]
MAVNELIRAAWVEPRPPGAKDPGRGDWILLAFALGVGLSEGALRPELSYLAWIGGLGILWVLPWRRSEPLLMVMAAFGGNIVLKLIGQLAGANGESLHALALMLLLPYAVFRWGAGREAMLGALVIYASAATDMGLEGAGVGDLIGAYAILSIAMSFGLVARFRARDRVREVERIQLQEREAIARDLHDTVAHHVSAIAVRAQAGLVTTPANPEAAAEALQVISREASRLLSEMRAMVGALRRDDPAALAPNPGLAELEGLAGPSPQGPEVLVEIEGEVDGLTSSLTGALYRLAQESITNARRHAKNATWIRVGIRAEDDAVRMVVRDDGESLPRRGPTSVGYGLVGMRERAELLGGSCQAGPEPGGGWTVTALLPTNRLEP